MRTTDIWHLKINEKKGKWSFYLNCDLVDGDLGNAGPVSFHHFLKFLFALLQLSALLREHYNDLLSSITNSQYSYIIWFLFCFDQCELETFPTLYWVGVNITNVLWELFWTIVKTVAFLHLQYRFKHYWGKKIAINAVCKMLVKLTTWKQNPIL